jgi:hypothetical protein
VNEAERHPETDGMTESELADYYYEHRADLVGDPVAATTTPRMEIMLSARFAAPEAEAVRAAAERAGMSVSAFLRQAVLGEAQNKVVDLARVRADLRKARELADDALRALA